MSKESSYYLFNTNGLYGPFTSAKIDTMRASGEIKRYVWIINEQLQSWEPVTAPPNENPFTKSKETLGAKDISAAFLVREEAVMGKVKGMHSYGIELWIAGETKRQIGITPGATVSLNIVDEGNLVSVNTKMKFQSFEDQAEGTLLRFGWIQPLQESL
jgi:hypothetical protein